MNNKILLGVVTLTVVAFGVIGSAQVFAQTTTGSSTLVEKIADKFGLKKEEVQAVFDQEREEHHKQMEAKFEERLAQLVKDGKITEAQKKLIENKHEEIEKTRESNRGEMSTLTPEERRSKMESQRTEFQTWAKQNGIDPTYLMQMGGRMGHGHFGGNK